MALTTEAAAKLDLFRDLSTAQVEELLRLGKNVKLSAGQTLFTLGAEADALYVVISGSVVLTLPVRIREEERSVPITDEGAGATLGWSALVPPHAFTLSAVANADSEVLQVPRAELEQLFERQPLVGLTVMRAITSLVGRRLNKLQAMWMREIQRRVDDGLRPT